MLKVRLLLRRLREGRGPHPHQQCIRRLRGSRHAIGKGVVGVGRVIEEARLLLPQRQDLVDDAAIVVLAAIAPRDERAPQLLAPPTIAAEGEERLDVPPIEGDELPLQPLRRGAACARRQHFCRQSGAGIGREQHRAVGGGGEHVLAEAGRKYRK